MNARDTLLEALLVNGVVPPVRSDDFLCLLHYLRGGQVLRLPSAVLCLQWVWCAIWGTGRNVSLKLFKTLWATGLPNHKFRKLHSVRLSPSLCTWVTELFLNFFPTNTWPRSWGPSHICVSPRHIKEIQERRRNNKISGLLAALSEVIPLHIHFSYRKITYSAFPFTCLMRLQIF